MRILLTGGTGSLGRAILAAGAESGTVLRVLSRNPRPDGARNEWSQADLVSGAGVAEAVADVDVIIHAASDPRNSAVVDVQGTRTLVQAARAARVKHLLYVSIVGVDAVPYPYYRNKLAAEDIVAQSGVPWSIQRITQFHSFIDFLFRAAARFPLILPLPTGFQVQSVDVAEAATRVLSVVAPGPAGRLRDFAGPEILTVGQAARAWKAARGIRKPIVPLFLPGKLAAAFRAGRTTAPNGDRGSVRWSDWLERQPAD